MKQFIDSHLHCIDCAAPITEAVFIFSSTHYHLPLCGECQTMFEEKTKKTTKETLDLYIALRKKKVRAELEKWDGYKSIDIAVVHARVNIEVDGQQHHFLPEQAIRDLWRTYYSFKKGYFTLRIPNALVIHHLEETAEYITKFLRESQDQLRYN